MNRSRIVLLVPKIDRKVTLQYVICETKKLLETFLRYDEKYLIFYSLVC